MIEDHNPLDASIDRAVREMLGAEPSRDFARRVIERLENGQPRRRAIWMMPLAAAALVILAFALAPLLRPRTITAPPQQAATIERPVTPSAPAPLAPERRTPEAHRHEPGRRPAMATAVPVDARSAPIAIEPLSSIEPIPVARVQTDSLAIAPVRVAPLAALAPIDVEPLSPTRDRD